MAGKKGGNGLGKALIKKHQSKHIKKVELGEMHKHTTDIIPTEKPRITSIIDQNSLEEFVQLAQLSNKNFTAEKEITIVNRKEVLQGSSESANAQKELLGNFLLTDSSVRNPKYKLLKIPRRPKWRKDMSAEEIQGQENVAFLQWRRDIASIEENNMTLAITPFEKNLDVWRQLWRVIEKADVLLQIVDARNPYFFYSADLEQYIKDVDKNRGKKQFMLLINKADYLTEELREHWSKYFKEMNVNHVFFSALMEQEKIDQKTEEEKEENEDEEDGEDSGEELVDKEEEKKQLDEEAKAALTLINSTHVFNRAELLALLGFKARLDEKTPDDRLMVGMVGYPNVGKSSVINVLCGRKRVGVASMPGKTKHFQTLNLEGKGSWSLCLCDCPGLVFPSFANSKSEMMCCGVLPIDTMKDYISPISLIIHRVPRGVLEEQYKIQLPAAESKNYSASMFLQILGAKKGLVTGRGLPNEAMAARFVLKDYVNGRLLFCHIRPDYDRETHGEIVQSGFKTHTTVGIPQIEADEEEKKEEDDVSEGDFEEENDEVNELQSHTAATDGGMTSMTTNSKYKAENNVESNLDREFFVLEQQQSIQQLKLNKGEKRALKFALKRGVNIEEIPNLKAYLEDQVMLAKARKNVKNVLSDAAAKAKKNDKYSRGNNNSNKFYAFTQFNEDGTGGHLSD